jgi:hypothetical protein
MSDKYKRILQFLLSVLSCLSYPCVYVYFYACARVCSNLQMQMYRSSKNIEPLSKCVVKFGATEMKEVLKQTKFELILLY